MQTALQMIQSNYYNCWDKDKKMDDLILSAKKSLFRFTHEFSNAQIMALGYFLVIFGGALLLMLPSATRPGQSTSFLTALFTATSSTCVTGLVVVDTSLHWTVFGQIVILVMIQVGGLGFMTMGVLFALFLQKKISLGVRGLVQESMNANEVGGMVRMVQFVVRGTLTIEAIGAILLAIRFVPRIGVLKGIYYGIFHSVSAFCNAGYDLMGYYSGAYASLVDYVGDPLINLVVMALIIIGGIGFFVWYDIYRYKFHWRKYALHTKMALSMTLFLIVVGTILLYVLERNNTLAGMNPGEGILASMFGSVTARTAGFNTTDTASLTSASKLVTILLMFIGGSPGSTAGGVKTVSVFVLVVYVWSNLRGERGCNVFGRRVSDENIKKASNVVLINLIMAMFAAIAISAMQAIPMENIMFEIFSAIGTVGMSTGITRDLNSVSRVIIILLMYCGRVGGMSFAMSFTERKKVPPVQLPVEKVMIG